MAKKLDKRRKQHKKISQRTSVTFKIEIYHKIHKLQRETNTKSFSRAVNILLNDELKNRKAISQPVAKRLTKNMSKLTQQVGQLNRNISEACNNLNQLAYDLNVKKYENESANLTKFIMQDGLKFREDIQALKRHKSELKLVRKEMNQIWQYLM